MSDLNPIGQLMDNTIYHLFLKHCIGNLAEVKNNDLRMTKNILCCATLILKN